MNLAASAIERFGAECEFVRHGESAGYAVGRALAAGFGIGGGDERLGERGRESGVRRVLYLLSEGAPPSASGGFVRVGGDELLVERCELVGGGRSGGFWRVVAEVRE